MMAFDVPPVVPHMIHTKGTYMTVLRGFCEKIDSATAIPNVMISYLPPSDLALRPVFACSSGGSHDSPDAGVGSVGSLVGALVLGDLVLGVDEAAV